MDEFNVAAYADASSAPEIKTYKAVALRGLVVFPAETVHFEVGRDKSLAAIERANADNEPIFLVAQKDEKVSDPSPEDLYEVGVLCTVQQIVKLPNDVIRVLVTGLERKKVAAFAATDPVFEVILEAYPSAEEDPVRIETLKRLISEKVAVFDKLDHKIPKDKMPNLGLDNLSRFIANATSLFYRDNDERQAVLEAVDLGDALEDIYAHIVAFCDVLEAEKRIALRVRESVDKNQKEYYLREQIKAIHSELGDDEDEAEQIRSEAKKRNVPDYVYEKIDKELNRMSKMAPNSPEAGVIRTYLEWVLDLPWNEASEDEIDLDRAEKVLAEDHYGLEKVKERIIEYLAVHKLSGNLKGAILCFVGPPGVGKTSIVTSIARAANRKLVQMSLGGVRDEAEIRGHRRTYIGAMPGRILSGMKTAGVNNPVFLLDEIDKMSSDFRGDPASAMLEVLDPNQNYAFKDHYLEIPYDLSKTMFVCTANTLDTIPTPLLDRMEVIQLSGYTYNEKKEIAKRYLFPKQLEANGMKKGSVTVTDDALMSVITDYTRESGVRNLERELAAAIRKTAVQAVKSKRKSAKFEITTENLEKYLGAPKFRPDYERKEDAVGLVTGLAWTSVGGVTLDVEVALIAGGKGEMTLTGNMGDVMKESARIALSLVRSRAEKYGIDPKKFTENDVHIHIPEGATPKDGPSAGVTLSTAIYSAFTGKKVRHDVAMTGEITLLGNVLAIGGLKEKSLAAMRHRVSTLIIPEENLKDVEEIPTEVKDSLTIKTVKTLDDVLALAIAENK